MSWALYRSDFRGKFWWDGEVWTLDRSAARLYARRDFRSVKKAEGGNG